MDDTWYRGWGSRRSRRWQGCDWGGGLAVRSSCREGAGPGRENTGWGTPAQPAVAVCGGGGGRVQKHAENQITGWKSE